MPFNLSQIFGGWRRKGDTKKGRKEASRRERVLPSTPPRFSTLGVESPKTPSVFPRGGVKSQSELARKLIVAPHISEKSAMLGESRYVFKIADCANKNSLKDAVEGRYGVEVKSVNIIAARDKKRSRGQIIGVKSGFKKAVVTLKAGQTISEF